MPARRQVSGWISRSMPVVFVAFLWVALWQMWPDPQPYRWSPGKKPFSIKFVSIDSALKPVRDPRVFAFDSGISYRAAVSDLPELLKMPDMPHGSGEFLTMSDETLKARSRGQVSEYSAWQKNSGGFEGAWGESPVFRKEASEKQLVVEMSEELEASGFAPENMTPSELDQYPVGWEVRLLLDVDKSGYPEHVLIEKGSGNKDIDKLVYRKVLQGGSGQKEVRGGRLKISYGFE